MKGRWSWALLALAALLVLVVVGTTVTLDETIRQAMGGIDIRIDGERVASIGAGEVAGWVVVAALLAALALVVVVPLSVLVALVLAALALAAALLAVLAVIALLLSPVWLTALVLWLVLRRRPARAAAAPGEA